MTLVVPSWSESLEQNDEPTSTMICLSQYIIGHWEDEFIPNCHVYVFHMLIGVVCLKYLRWQHLRLCKINEFSDDACRKYELLYKITNSNFNNHEEILIKKKHKYHRSSRATQGKINYLCTHCRFQFFLLFIYANK